MICQEKRKHGQKRQKDQKRNEISANASSKNKRTHELQNKPKLDPAVNFDQFFPHLMTNVNTLKHVIDLNKTQEKLQMAEKEELSQAVNQFYTGKMQILVELVSTEIEAVLGQFWTQLKKRSFSAA